MADTELAAVRLRLATDQAEALQRGLRQRQEDLLALEESVQRLRTGRSDGRVLIDQVEDVRRAVHIHGTDQLAEVRTTLSHAKLAVAHADCRR